MTSEDTREEPYPSPSLVETAAETGSSCVEAEKSGGSRETLAPTPLPRSLLPRRWAAFWAALWAAAILYGSVVVGPTSFHFVSLPSGEAWRLLLQIPYVVEGSAQQLALLESVVFLIPLGFLVAGSVWPARPTLWRVAVAGLSLFVCMTFVLAVKYLQLYFPPRSVTLNVAFAQMIGALLGVALYPIADQAFSRIQSPRGGTGFRAQWETARRFGRILSMPLSWCVALALTLLIIWLVVDLPVARAYVGAALLICFVIQLRFPSAWLFFVPALLPVFDLTLWSGRLYFDEFDLLVLTAVAAHFWQSPAGHRVPNLLRWPRPVFAVLALWFLASAAIGFVTLSHLPAGEWGAYYSDFNALRVVKSTIWALLLLAPLQWRLAVNPAKAKLLFILGASAGLMAVGLATLWERGVFVALAHMPAKGLYASRYDIAGPLLDFTQNYRAMALFSELHTGGEAIDTYIALAPAIAAAGALAFRAPLARLFSLSALGFGTYAAVVTFSRGSYAGLVTAMVVVFAMAIGGRSSSRDVKLTAFLGVAAGLVALPALFNVFRFGGYDALVAGFALSALTIGNAHFVGERSRFAAAIISAALVVGATYAFAHFFLVSRYDTLDLSEVLQWGAICACALVGAFALIGYRTMARKFWPTTWSAFLAFSVICVVGIPSFGGTRMQDRLGQVSEDSQTRISHWLETLRLMEGDWRDYVFGMGFGTYPRIYYLDANSPETKSSYRISGDATRDWLELGAADFNITQKIPMQPNTHYQLGFLMRSSSASGGIDVKLCPKYIVISDRYTPNCLRFSIAAESPGRWVRKTLAFDSGRLGADVPAYWPITLMFNNGGIVPPVQLTDISISDGRNNIVANGDFAHGMDRWILISDFEHLAWHIKDVYLEIFFETGAIGLALYLLTMSVAFVRAFSSARRQDPIGLAALGALAAFSVVGVVGSLLDNPRPALLFFILLFWTLCAERPNPRDADA
jgi:hypothetical protein